MIPLSNPLWYGRAMAVAGLVATSPTVTRADPVDWKTVGDWDVSYYPQSAGCQAYGLFEQGAAIFLGYDNNDGVLTLDITALDAQWTVIKDNTKHAVTLRFGDEAPWVLEMAGVMLDGFPGLNIMIDASSEEAALLVNQFQQEASMDWSIGETQLGRYTLRGSQRAFEEVMACQKSYGMTQTATADPILE